MENKLRISPLFARGGTLVQHCSLQSGNLLASFPRYDLSRRTAAEWRIIMKIFGMTAVLSAVPLTAFAADNVPPESIERISWAVKGCGKMPLPMFIGFVILAATAAITILCYKNGGGDDK